MASFPAPGTKAPAFKLARDGGGSVSLADYKGRKLVLYFYPNANTTGYTKESIAFNALKADFAAADTDIVGVSADPVSAQEKFRDKYDLPCPPGSDPDKAMLEAYGVWVEKSMYGRKYMGIERATLLIGRDGKVAQTWPKVKVAGHAEEVLKAAQALA